MDGRLLTPGSSGSSGRYFQGSGAGGGALQIIADGDFYLDGGALLSASGGNGRSDLDPDKAGGGGSGGTIHVFAQNIYNKGMIQTVGGNAGASDGQILFGYSRTLEKGNINLGNGNLIEISPPNFSASKTEYLSFGKTKSVKPKIKALTRTENLILHWPMEENQGFLLLDAIGNAHANLSGRVNRVDGKLGKAVEFDGVSAYAWTKLDSENLNINGKYPRTISFWAEIHPLQEKNKPGPYGYGELSSLGGFDQYWGLYTIPSTDSWTITSEHYGSSFSNIHPFYESITWSHLAHIYDGTKASVFIDGILLSSIENPLINTGNEEPLLLGRATNDNQTFFKGKIDDFRIYNRALSQIEISAISRAEDIVWEFENVQFPIEINGVVDQLSISSLPSGLSFDPLTKEIIGIPTEAGVFDVNINASNRAGSSSSAVKIVVNKSLPEFYSVSPRSESSSGVMASAVIDSDGGEELNMTLFWGLTDGEDNPNQWDHNFTLEEKFSSGKVSKFIDGFDKNQSGFYRWMASNSVASNIWSTPPSDGLVHWWSFDQVTGNKVLNEQGNAAAYLENMGEGNRVFGRYGQGMSFSSDENESIIVNDYKGISGNQPRTISMWIHTSDEDGQLWDYGGDELGESFSAGLKGGKLQIGFGGGLHAIYETQLSDSRWHHVVVVFPENATSAGNLSVFVDGQPVEQSFFDYQSLIKNTLLAEVWFDASDLDANGIIDSTASGNISAWSDKSGKEHNATSVGTPYLNTSTGPSNGRAIEIRGGDYLPVSGTFFAKDQFVVLRSPPANTTWSSYGGPFGWNGSSHTDARDSNYFFIMDEPQSFLTNILKMPGKMDLKYPVGILLRSPTGWSCEWSSMITTRGHTTAIKSVV